jgi:hypothetical protein
VVIQQSQDKQIMYQQHCSGNQLNGFGLLSLPQLADKSKVQHIKCKLDGQA